MNKNAQDSYDYGSIIYPELSFKTNSTHIINGWVGGLPKMPIDVEWPNIFPKDHPKYKVGFLQHVAQINCAALPHNVWNGAGPRHGWLIFFNDITDENGLKFCKVVHIETLGPMRKPPEGTRSNGVRILPYWPLDFLSEAEKLETNVIDSVIDPHPHKDADALRPEYTPFESYD